MFSKKFFSSKNDILRYLLHIALILGVTLYTIIGAVIIQFIEQPSNSSAFRKIRKRSQDVIQDEWTNSFQTDITRSLPSAEECISNLLKQLIISKSCQINDIDRLEWDEFDQCYLNPAHKVSRDSKHLEETDYHNSNHVEEKWSFLNAIIFSYTVITTIGYGHITPVTTEGRIFCIIYGSIGIPFTLLTIADLGMFISKLLKWIANQIISLNRQMFNLKLKISRNGRSCTKVQQTSNDSTNLKNTDKVTKITKESDDDSSGISESCGDSVILGIAFLTYLIFGAYAFSLYEPDMDFFTAIYFNFVTLTTIGLGDLVPRREKYLIVTLIYITIGLALTTRAMERAANLLKKIHYFGRQIENISQMTVWFGGQKLTMKQLVKHLGDKMNVPINDLINLNIDKFVESAIKVEEGEITSLRKQDVVMRSHQYPCAFRYSAIRKSVESENLKYIDDKIDNKCENEPALAIIDSDRLHVKQQ